MTLPGLAAKDTLTPTSSGAGRTLPPGVEQFIAENHVEVVHVPEGNCLDCHRTLVAVSIYIGSNGRAVWHMTCPVHRTALGMET